MCHPEPVSTALSPDDRFALSDLVARYADAVDRRTFDGLAEVFVADGVLDTGRGVRHGLAEIVAAMAGLHRYVATAHVLGQQLLEPVTADDPGGGPDGDRVRGMTVCTAHHLSDHGDHRTDRVMHIRYHDEYVRTSEGWRIRHRRLEVPWTDTRTVG